jgi:hypothetical protein
MSEAISGIRPFKNSPGFRHSASIRAFTPVFDGLWTRVNALIAHPGYGLFLLEYSQHRAKRHYVAMAIERRRVQARGAASVEEQGVTAIQLVTE